MPVQVQDILVVSPYGLQTANINDNYQNYASKTYLETGGRPKMRVLMQFLDFHNLFTHNFDNFEVFWLPSKISDGTNNI